MTYDGKPLRTQRKATCGIVNSGICRDKYIFNNIRNKINKANGKINTFVGLKNANTSKLKNAAKRLLQCFEYIIVNFERVVEINNGVFFIHPLVN